MILEVLTGKNAKRQIAVPTTGAVLGRGSECDIALDEPTLSEKHCRIISEKGEWVVQDLGSPSGVIVNGQKTSGSPLKQGDEIKLGLLCLKVLSLSAPQVAPSRPPVTPETKGAAVSDNPPAPELSSSSSQQQKPPASALQADGGSTDSTRPAGSPKATLKRNAVIALAVLAGLVLLGAGFYVIRKGEVAAAHRRNVRLYDTALAAAKEAIARKDIQTAIDRLQAAVALPDDVDKTEASNLLNEAQSSLTSPQQVLQGMSDSDFQALCATGQLPPSAKFSYEPLNTFYLEKFLAAEATEASRRKAAQAEAEHKAKAEAERLAKADAKADARAENEVAEAEEKAGDGAERNKSKSDDRVRKLLDELGVQYSIDKDGNFKTTVRWPVGRLDAPRTKTVYINSSTETYEGIEVREVWAYGYEANGDFNAQVANRLLEENGKKALGAWRKTSFKDGTSVAGFCVSVAANCDKETLRAMRYYVAVTADGIEQKVNSTPSTFVPIP